MKFSFQHLAFSQSHLLLSISTYTILISGKLAIAGGCESPSQGKKKRAIQCLCAGSPHLGFDNELVARFPDGAVLTTLINHQPNARLLHFVAVRFRITA
jgi:hypothetical protein